MKITEQVENILKASTKARNSDRELLVIYMQKAGMGLSDKQILVFKGMPSVETIRRTRQMLQEQGKYLPSKEVEEVRFKKFQNMRQAVGSVDPEAALEQRGYKVLPWGG